MEQGWLLEASILRIRVGLTPPKKTLTSDQIIISYVNLFLNNEKKPQMDGSVRKPASNSSLPNRVAAAITFSGTFVKNYHNEAK